MIEISEYGFLARPAEDFYDCKLVRFDPDNKATHVFRIELSGKAMRQLNEENLVEIIKRSVEEFKEGLLKIGINP